MAIARVVVSMDGMVVEPMLIRALRKALQGQAGCSAGLFDRLMLRDFAEQVECEAVGLLETETAMPPWLNRQLLLYE